MPFPRKGVKVSRLIKGCSDIFISLVFIMARLIKGCFRMLIIDVCVAHNFNLYAVLSGYSSSITVTAPPVASWMRRAKRGDGRRLLLTSAFM